MQKDKITFSLLKSDTTPSWDNCNYPTSFSIPSEDIIFDETTQSPVKIRYAPGEKTIIKDQQSKSARGTKPVFSYGYLEVSKYDTTLLSYLRACNWIDTCENRMPNKKALFKEYNPEIIAKKIIEQENVQISALTTFTQLNTSGNTIAIRDIALSLGFNVNRHHNLIAFDVMNYAKENPASFLEMVDDPTVERIGEIQEAISKGIIKIDKQYFNWVGGHAIISIPSGVDELKYFANYSFTDGVDVWAEIKKRMDKPQKELDQEILKDVQTYTTAERTAIDKMSANEIFDIAKKLKFIIFKPPYNYYVNENSDPQELRLKKSKHESSTWLYKERPDLWEEIKGRIIVTQRTL